MPTMCNSYVSCIRINGLPILPPLLNEKRRLELAQMRQKAISIESYQKDKKNKSLQANIEILENKETPRMTSTNLKTTETSQNSQDSKATTITTNLSNSMSSKKVANLTSETFDVSEYSDNGVIVLNSNESDTNDSGCKLTRSNSYVLLSPSTVLLAHLNNEGLVPSKTAIVEANEEGHLQTVEPIIEISVHTTGITDTTGVHCGSSQSSTSSSNCCSSSGSGNSNSLQKSSSIEQEILHSLSDMTETSKMDILQMIKNYHAGGGGDRNESTCVTVTSASPIESNSAPELNHYVHSQIVKNQYYEKTNKISVSPNNSLYYSAIEYSDGDVTPLTNGTHHNNRKISIGPMEPFSIKKRISSMNNLAVKLSEEKAASIIGAAAKGYLTKRLMRTERVQILIQTIKDVLLCAVDVHKSASIDHADIELHRRLIHQLSAACYAFHNVFFGISIKEQMSIIAADRQRTIDKSSRSASRITSARSVSSASASRPISSVSTLK